MSWCCLTSGDERSAIKIEGYARNDDGEKRYQNAAALHHFLRRTFSALPVEPTEPTEPLSNAIKGWHVPGLTLKFESRDEWLGMSDW